jgi:hypothetical protein
MLLIFQKIMVQAKKSTRFKCNQLLLQCFWTKANSYKIINKNRVKAQWVREIFYNIQMFNALTSISLHRYKQSNTL